MSPGELPRKFFLTVQQMGDHKKANLCAVGSEEDLFDDKKNINSQFFISIELDEICGNFDNALHYPLGVPPHCVTFHLEDGASPNHFGGLYILKCNITTRDTPALPIALKSTVVGEIIFLDKSFA
jgi:hypothetical protein